MIVLLVVTVIFFAGNMGISGIAPSFAAPYGACLITRQKAAFFFFLFVIAGAVLLGSNVCVTLGKSLLGATGLGNLETVVILGAAAFSLFLANALKIPQSTSQVTVGAVTGAGLFLGRLGWRHLVFKILPLWILLPLASFVITFLLYRRIYPPRAGNMHLYERVLTNEKNVKVLAVAVGCYVAFAIGSNNVGNAVGPLYGAGVIGIGPGLLAISPLFGLGAFLLGSRTLETTGKQIVPLGLVSCTLVSLVTATLLLGASLAGVPQSLVQLNCAAVFAISCLKNGHRGTWSGGLVQKIVLVWLITPLVALSVTYGLLSLFIRR